MSDKIKTIFEKEAENVKKKNGLDKLIKKLKTLEDKKDKILKDIQDVKEIKIWTDI